MKNSVKLKGEINHMDDRELQVILTRHKMWINDEEGGERADLRGEDLSGFFLNHLCLKEARLNEANLRGAELFYSDLSGADLRNADLYGADLRYTNLQKADLSDATGLLSPIDFIKEHFETTADGIIAYKTFNASVYKAPEHWELKPGAIISENVNANRTELCGCGINVAPLEWVKENKEYYRQDVDEIWKLLIRWEWACGIVVPYNTDGKIRCERAELIEVVE